MGRMPVLATSFALLLLALPSTPIAHSQASAQSVIRGRVTDAATGRPLPDAQVAIVGTGFGARAGNDGAYTITGVPAGTHVARATRVGYAQEERSVTVAAGQSQSADFTLDAEAVLLEGVVAVGYGTQRRSDVTGSVASVSAARLEQTPNTSVEQALQAAVPGVTVQTASAGAEQNNNIMIRGQNSIRASTAPLVVVDGIPYNGPLSEINPNDVASIDILKDASSAAIYGARGSNGVILVTTKRGNEGKPRFGYQGHAGFQEAVNIPRLMNGVEWARWRCQLRNAGQDCAQRVYTQTEIQGLAEGRSTDWLALALRKGFQHQHDLSFSGGAGGTRYYIAGSMLDVEGIARNDRFQRATLRVNLSQEVTSWLDMGTSTQLSNVDRSGVPASFSGAFNISPLTVPYDADGNLTIRPWAEDPFFSNPLQGLLVVDDNLTRRVISNNHLEIRLPFLSGLSYRLNGGVDFAAQDEGQYYGRNTSDGVEVNGRAIVRNSTFLDWTLENILRFSRDFGSHNLDVTGLYSVQASDQQRESLDARGFPNDVLTYYQPNVATLVQPSSTVTEWQLHSQMGRLNYGYDDRYLLTLTARRDGYSGFGQNHKYGVFPSVALAWNVSNEAFWPFGESVNSLKLRASYGQNGNQAITPYQTLARLREVSYLDGESTAPGFIPSSLANPNLRWETTTSANFGVDFGLFGERLRGTLDAYSSRTHDLLLDRLVSPVHGITRITENIGQVRNRGVELALSTVNLETTNFTWSTDLNVSANRNEIAALYGDGRDDVANRWFIGQPIDVNFGYIIDGIWQLTDDIRGSAQPTARPGEVKIRDLDGDGKITPADRGFIGDRDPSYIGGLTNTLRYGAVSLDFFLQSVQGVTSVNGLLAQGRNLFEGRGNTLVLPYWTPENPTNSTPANRFDANPLAAEFYEDASFVRLKDLTLSLEVPGGLTGRVGAERLRLYVNGRNLWTSTEWRGLDPELGNQTAIPLQRVLTAGVNASF